jgi:hypothetical protein
MADLSRFTLDETVELNESHASPAWNLIREGYKSKRSVTRCIAVFLGCLLSSNRLFVLLSRREVSTLLRNAPGLSPTKNSISQKEFDRLKAYLVKSQIIKVHQDSSSFESKKRRAARVEHIAEPFRSEIIEALGPDDLKIHEEAFQDLLQDDEEEDNEKE